MTDATRTTYYDTIEEDLARAKEILAKGKLTVDDLAELPEPLREIALQRSGHIYGADIYAAYKLLESFVARVQELERERKVILQTAMDWGCEGDVQEFINLLALSVRRLEREVVEKQSIIDAGWDLSQAGRGAMERINGLEREVARLTGAAEVVRLKTNICPHCGGTSGTNMGYCRDCGQFANRP